MCLTPLQLETLQLSSHCRTFKTSLYVSYEVCVRSLLNSFFFFSNKMQLAVVFRENGECLFSTTRPEPVILVEMISMQCLHRILLVKHEMEGIMHTHLY